MSVFDVSNADKHRQISAQQESSPFCSRFPRFEESRCDCCDCKSLEVVKTIKCPLLDNVGQCWTVRLASHCHMLPHVATSQLEEAVPPEGPSPILWSSQAGRGWQLVQMPTACLPLRGARRFLYARCVPKIQEYHITWQNPDVFGDKISKDVCSLKIDGKAYKEQQPLATISNNQRQLEPSQLFTSLLLCELSEDFGRVRVT